MCGENGPANNIFDQKRGPVKTILGKKKWSGNSPTGRTADDGLVEIMHVTNMPGMYGTQQDKS